MVRVYMLDYYTACSRAALIHGHSTTRTRRRAADAEDGLSVQARRILAGIQKKDVARLATADVQIIPPPVFMKEVAIAGSGRTVGGGGVGEVETVKQKLSHYMRAMPTGARNTIPCVALVQDNGDDGYVLSIPSLGILTEKGVVDVNNGGPADASPTASDPVLSSVLYYCQRSLFHSAYKQCETALRRRTSDPILMFWKAFSLIMQGKSGEALRELEPLQEKRDLMLACPAAMVFAHERCKLVDHEAMHELQAKLTIASSSNNVSDRALIQMALFYWQTGQHDQARAYLKKVVEAGPVSGNPGRASAVAKSPQTPGANSGAGSTSYWMAVTFMGWVDLTCGQDSLVSRSNSWFDKILDEFNPKDLDAMLGRLQYLRTTRQKLAVALDINSQIITYHTSFIPAYIERMYVLLEMGSWELVVEAAQRVSTLSPDSIDTYAVLCLNELCREGRAKVAANHLSNLNLAISKTEPSNAGLYFSMAQAFSRLAGRRESVLEQTLSLAAKAVEIDSSRVEFKCELGFIHFLLGNLDKATEIYRTAFAQNSHDMTAMHGLIKCFIYKGRFDEAEEQIEFLEAVQSTNMSAETSYLSSLMARYKYHNIDKQARYLKHAYELVRKSLTSKMIGLSYYVKTNPDFLMELALDFLENCPQSARREGEELHPFLVNAYEILLQIIKIAPGSTEACYSLGKVKYLMGDMVAAQSMANNCLKLDSTHPNAHVLIAQIQLSNGNTKGCLAALDNGLSNNFEVRHIVLFHILKAKALKIQGNNDEALKVLNSAMGMSVMRESEERHLPTVKRSDITPTVADKASLYLELADAFSKTKNSVDAAKVMEEASRIFGNTSESHRIVLANADLALERGEIDTALVILSNIGPSHLSFVQAKSKMGMIYLTQKKDRKAYARCYGDLYDRHKTVETCILLGEAYMNIQEPEKAIEVYENGLDTFDDGSVLACKIGKALVKTHDYARAISYYETALGKNTPNAASLRFDLAELYFKLKNYQDVERVVFEALDHPKSDDSTVLALDVKLNLLHAKGCRASGKYDFAITHFTKSRDLQLRILSAESITSDSSELKAVVADICFELGETYANNMGDLNQALVHYNEALQYQLMHQKSILAICKHSITRNDLTTAQSQCTALLRSDPDNQAATIIMAELQFLSNSYSAAVSHFKTLLEKQPTQFFALRKAIEMMRRAGKMSESQQFFDIVEKSSFGRKILLHAGYHFCKGLQYRYTNSPNEALKEFNYARRDAEWGTESLFNMIEIFLNPDNETMGGDVLEAAADSSGSGDQTDADILALLTADKLLKELPQNPKSIRAQILECHAWMATKQKTEIERALAHFTQILQEETDHVPSLLGIAVAYMLLKQPPRARNQLKRIVKMEWNVQYADDFERAWLLLADIHIQGGKYDLATDLLKRCLAQNKSCSKAYEYLGYIMEKEASYKDAADSYTSAWKLERESNASIGFKLAFNYLKAKKFVEAIEVCHKVLKMYPDYPKIRKEILDKARGSLRV
ncbi:Tetratricopeptide repeat protein 21B [Rhizoclosmatium hyalinum]|nr:Tetratricopeptide repeat protein 21B [Rhizoclosmatium hyalinum]